MRRLFTLIPITMLGMAAVRASTLPPDVRGPLYDPATETTLRGNVEQIELVEQGSMTGVHLMVDAGRGLTEIALGPLAFLKSKGFVFAKGDDVEVTGSLANWNSKNFVIAREIKHKGKTLALRDKSGTPTWPERRMRARPVY